MNDRPVAAESTAGDRRPHRLGIRVITMSTRSVQRSRFRRRRTEPPTGTARRHWAEGLYAAVHPYSSTFLRPFAPGPLQALRRSYGRSDSCSPGSSAFLRHELRLSGEQVSLIHAPDLPTIPSPTTCGCCVSSGHATHRRIAPRFHPTTGSSPNGNSGLRLQLAGSPHLTGRIEFLIVRTGRSPPAAPHPVSPRRSCRLITSYVSSVRTSTSLIVCALRRTSRGQRPRKCRPFTPSPLPAGGERGAEGGVWGLGPGVPPPATQFAPLRGARAPREETCLLLQQTQIHRTPRTELYSTVRAEQVKLARGIAR